ncbi:extracellular solute-binding protein [Allonocardiopsis opalescens]|uniref:Carbohydrate ABC transporter substrate-binding protein (CUT1 family) n=1 Tax=Allonocardiopsis opalescens TaxID=1144618 RepID=A0A2T0PX19_9ACTN|nr:extracellular solute-binding protein [Allonocardiopsis opalescens]PRX96089.1 carbohydrate ABC transporter substrate-binding protein (CUT1 family) [Allonocardiopsis opalescens]
MSAMPPRHRAPSTSTKPWATRRRFLGVLGFGAAAAASGGLLSACAPSGPRPGSGGASAAAVDSLDALCPTYTPYEALPPDIPGQHGAPSGFTSYPTELVQAVAETPGRGGHYRFMAPLWAPIPPGLGDNSFYDAVNGRLGATVEFSFQDGNTITDRLNVLIASREVSDITMVPDWAINLIPNFAEAAGELFEDLTPYLAGDEVAPYPMLASLPTPAWRWGIFNQRLQGVPWPSDPYNEWMFYRQDVFEANGWPMPANAAELMELGREINDPDNNRWAFGDMWRTVRQVFRTPRDWRYENGELIHRYETEELAAAVEFMREVYDADLIHPDVISSRGAGVKELFNSGEILVYQDGFGGWTEAYRGVLAQNPDFRMNLLPAFAHDGGTPSLHPNDPSGQCVLLRRGMEPDQIREVLGLINYCTAPFGTREYMMYRYGVEGEHYELDGNGAPQRTELGQREYSDGYLFLSGRNNVIAESEYPGYVESYTSWYNDAAQYRAADPFEGIRIQRPSAYSAIEQPTEDKITDIIRGRRPVSDITQVVDEWRRDGGEEAREFYHGVLQENGRD